MAIPKHVARWKRISFESMKLELSKEKFNNPSLSAYVRVIIDLGLIEYIDQETGHMIVQWALLRKVLQIDQQEMNKFVRDCNFQQHQFNYRLVRFEENKHWPLRFHYYKAFWYRDIFLKGKFITDLASAVLKIMLARNPEVNTTCKYEVESDQRMGDSKSHVAQRRRELFVGIVTLFDCLEDRKVPDLVVTELREHFKLYFKDIAYVIHLFS